MIKIKIIVIYFIILFSCTYIPQKTQEVNNPKLFKPNTQMENRGAYTTSVGKLRALFIFVKFKDDTIIHL